MPEKEIWKLLELLNEYQKETKKAELYDFYIKWGFIVCDFLSTVEEYGYVINSRIEMDYWDEILISKSFWFIQRLVEQDKIDTDAYKTVYSWDLDKWKTLTREIWWDDFYQVTEHWVYESLLMLLSISEQPIDDLISYLK
jgi:hypothetical protein